MQEILQEVRGLREELRRVAKAPPPPPPLPQLEKPRDVIDELETAVKDFEAKRSKLREVLEKLGFRVEDLYMRRDEVEKLVEEVKKNAVEEALDDKRIEAVKNIIQDSIARLIELFRPAVQAIFSPPEERTTPPPASEQSSEKREVVESGLTK